MADVVNYRVVHETRYDYSGVVSGAHQLAHLRPRETDWQRVRTHHLNIEPPPSELSEATDYFGNGVMRFAVDTPHDALTVRAESVNFFNTPQFAGPGDNLASPNFGQITNTLNDGRTFRFTLRLGF